MSNSLTKPPVWFWVVSVLALIWNVMGVNAYIQQSYNTESFRAMYNADQLALFENTPAWATAAFALAVFGGALGCLALILRKKIAKPLFLISLLGVIVQFTHGMFIAKSYEFFETFQLIMTIMVPIVAVLLVLLAKRAYFNNWIA